MYGPPSSNSPQPEWRLPSSHPQQPSQAPPPPTTSPAYNPVSYGPMHSVAAPMSSLRFDTTAWGVRYNQHQQQSFSPPPLPPRLPGTAEPTHGSPHSPAVTTPSPNQPLSNAPVTASQLPPANFAYAPQQTTTPIPPAPPSFPPVYQQQNNQTWQQQPVPAYLNTPPPYNYGPPTQPAPTLLPPPRESSPGDLLASGSGSPNISAQQSSQQPPPPVPPKTTSTIVSTGPSALGYGTPSDWEHLSPTPGQVNDDEAFLQRRDNSPSVSMFQPPIEHSPAVYSPEVNNQAPPPKRPPVFLPTIQTPSAETQGTVQRVPSTSAISPVGPQELLGPSHPVRVDSFGTNHSAASDNDPSESIDGVIDAWNQPISPVAKPSTESGRQSSHSFGGPSPIQRQSPAIEEMKAPPKQDQPDPLSTRPASAIPGSDAKVGAVQPKLDPYEDLDPWSKSSLTRYVAMLRKEAVADSDEERFKIFTAFIAKETKLREILYNIESTSNDDEGAARQSIPVRHMSQKIVTTSTVESGPTPVEQDGSQHSPAAEDDFEGLNYSPGGRPILPTKHSPTTPTIQRSTSHATRLQPSQSSGTPVVGPQSQFARSTSVPPSIGGQGGHVQKQAPGPLTTNPPQPIYTPFRYTEGPQRGSDNLMFDHPAYQAYSALRQASAESGRVMANPSTSNFTPRASTMSPASASQDEHDETFIGLIRAKSVAYRGKEGRRPSSPPPLPASLRHGARDPIHVLRSMVSAPLAKQSESSWHVTTRKNLERFPDDFSYIQEAQNSWEAAARERRESLDMERMRRQEESEHNVDALFNEKEIGYADINTLEEEFRETEARVQLDEERRELDYFISDVFDPLDRRLGKEISTLQIYYDSALSQLDHENSKIKDSETDKYNISFTMKLVSEIHQKLEARYHKRLEIALDRERRRKKAERRPLVFMGESLALKHLDGEFDRMEKRSIVEAARDRDERANRLMDSFDDAIVHGLGENQSLLDEISAKVDTLDPATMQSSGVPDSEIEQMLTSVFTMVEPLRQDSESILRSFWIADSTLNDADYSVSVAEARYSNSDADVFRQLGDEKKKEDEKIRSELESKLESVRNGPAGITAKINELLGALGKDPMAERLEPLESITSSYPADVWLSSPRSRPSSIAVKAADSDPEHQERLRKALEDAKRRNAARNRSLSRT